MYDSHAKKKTLQYDCKMLIIINIKPALINTIVIELSYLPMWKKNLFRPHFKK